MPHESTAEILGAFRKELVEQGFDQQEAFVLSRDALPGLIEDGLTAKMKAATSGEVPA